MTAIRPIPIVEGNKIQSSAPAGSLGGGGEVEIRVAATLSEAETLLDAEGARYDTAIIDPERSGGDANRCCAKLGELGHRLPIIIATGSAHEDNIAVDLDAEVNDCLTKPFRLNKLLARLRARLGILDNSDNVNVSVGPSIFHPAARLLTDQSQRRLCLSGNETAILKFLCKVGANSVTRSILLGEVRGYNCGVSKHTRETLIDRLRQKIECDPANCQALIPEGGGYRLNSAAASCNHG